MDKKIIDFFSKDRFAMLNGIQLVECRPGYAKSTVHLEDRHLNAANLAHGGLLFTLADFTFAAAVNAYGYVTLAISNNISFFNAGNRGLIVAEATELSRSRRLISCNVSVRDEEGILLADFKGTAYITKEKNNLKE